MDMAKPIIRFKGYQDDWEQRKLGDICKMNGRIGFRGYTEKDIITKEAGGILTFSPTNIVDNQLTIGVKNTYITREKYNESPEIMVQKGNILFVKTGSTLGKSALVTGIEEDCTVNPQVVVIKVESNLQKILSVVLTSSPVQKQIAAVKIGGAVPTMTETELKNIDLALPQNVNERIKIGEYFENFDNLITLHQRKCDETKRLKKYMLQKMFPQNGKKVPEIRFSGFTDDWEQRKLGDLVIDHNAGIYISKEDYGEGTNVIGVGNIYDRDIFDGEIYRLGPVNDDKFILDENDILYGESSLVPEGIARTVCVGKNGAGSAFAWHTRRVKLDKNIVNSHVATLELNYLHDIRKYLVSVSTQTALTGMTTEGYFGVTLTLPSVEEQQKISDYFKNLDHLITLHQRELENLQNIKKFMLEKMFV